MALPNTGDISRDTSGDWDLPVGTVLMKQFRRGNRLIETRLLMRHPDGGWGGYSYEWNAQQTDATLVRGGAQRVIDGQTGGSSRAKPNVRSVTRMPPGARSGSKPRK